MRTVPLLLIVGACGFNPIGASDGPKGIDTPPLGMVDWLPSYGFRKPFTINAGVALDDFPVSILINDPDLATHATSASELVFTAGDGTTLLPSQIVALTSGALDAWVGVPVLSSAVTVYLYYGGGTAAPADSPWKSYVGVWHLSGISDEPDSSPSANHAVVQNANFSPGSIAGEIGLARNFDANDSLDVGDRSSLDVGDGSFSYEVWVNITGDRGQFDTPLYKGGSAINVRGYDIELGTAGWKAQVVDDANHLVAAPFNTAAHNTWLHLAAVIDRTAGKLTSYTNGLPATSVPLGTFGTLDNASGFQLGRTGVEFIGSLDEARVIKTALPAIWINAEYRNAMMRSTFVVPGLQQVRPTDK